MRILYDAGAAKKPKNLSINSDLLDKIEDLNLNLSATLEEALAVKLKEHKQKEWKEQNRGAIEGYNDFVEENGCFSDDVRTF
ncbi:MAG: type II toxin-antitoxin system CcdA family antitoxin [Endozoicomonas sp.]|uniref:type II toxin-antitoxin system CcdA family antitoxin n=1 Tax=Endozoicomonas sp. TaxID=1892382 RepID=UPI003D9BEA78